MNRFIRLSGVQHRVPLSKATIYRKIREGAFPKPYALDGSGRSVAWLESDIDAWIDQRIHACGPARTPTIAPQIERLEAHDA
jgi:prophage regulatory protein